MKILLLASLCLFNLNSFARDKKMDKDWDKKMDKMSFEDAKKWKMEMIDKRASIMDDEKKCLSEAMDRDSMKKCMNTAMEKEKEMKAEMKDSMKEKDMKKM